MVDCSSLLLLVTLLQVLSILGVSLAAVIPQLNAFLAYGKTLTSYNGNAFINIYIAKKRFVDFYLLDWVLSLSNLIYFSCNSPHFTNFTLVSVLNLLQSIRRIYECLYVSKHSPTSKIHIFHYFAGIFFYSIVNLIPLLTFISNPYSYHSNTTKLFIPIALFFWASYDQFFNHYLFAIQKKYTLPNQRLFKYLVCPHYFDEVLIYLSQFLIIPNLNFSLIVVWVVINLGISANQSYLFYQKNNLLKTKHFKIIPFLY